MIAVGYAETSVLRSRTRRNQVAAALEREIGDRGIGMACHVHARVPAGEVGLIRLVESVEPKLELPGFTQPGWSASKRDGAVVEAAAQVILAGLEPDTPDLRRGKRGAIELPVNVAQLLSGTGIADHAGAIA